MTFNMTTLPLSELRIDDKANVRKIGRDVADPVMMGSIEAIGVKQALIVRPNGKGHVVVDGGKRLAALQALLKQGKIKPDHPVPVSIEKSTDAVARETSLALNVARVAMHPVDEFRAFVELHTDKTKPMDVEAIALRFGLSTNDVRQRLALGDLDDTILDAWRAGTLGEKALKAFTLCTDKKQQARILAKCIKEEGRPNDWTIRQMVLGEKKQVGRFLDAIGVESYEKRGGRITRDLFGTEHQVSDPALVETMCAELVKSTCDALIADGWLWALPTEAVADYWSFGRLQNDKEKPSKQEAARLKELEAICENDDLDQDVIDEASDEADRINQAIRARTLSKEQKAKAGCFVGFDNTGKLSIEYGRVKPANKKSERDDKTGETTDKNKAKAKPAGAVSKALTIRLGEQLTKASALSLHQQPNVALAALVATFHSITGRRPIVASVKGAHGSGQFSTAFEAALKRSVADLGKEIAQVVAKSSDFVDRFGGAEALKDQNIAALCNAIDAKAFNKALRETFDAKDYFDSIGRPQIVAAVREAMGETHATNVGKLKKDAATKFAVTNVPKTGWLPLQLRTAHYDGPQAKPAKAKAAKPVKRAPAKKAKRK
jgi:ParB family chromosome partitioning protein